MSEWLLFNANPAIFCSQLYHGENKLIFIEMMMRSALYKTNTPSWIFIVLARSQSLEGEISLPELTSALKRMKNNKSPGLDGFTADFFNLSSDLLIMDINKEKYMSHSDREWSLVSQKKVNRRILKKLASNYPLEFYI